MPWPWNRRRRPATRRGRPSIFELTFDHLFAAYCDLGDHPDEALERAAGRVSDLRMSIKRIAETPSMERCDPIFIRGSAFCDETGLQFGFCQWSNVGRSSSLPSSLAHKSISDR